MAPRRPAYPAALRPGDPVALFAGSGPFDRTLALRGAAWLAERYRVVFRPSVFSRHGYLAGSDERRRDEVAWAMSGVARAAVAIRGGYGLGRIVDGLDWTAMRRTPCWIVGFSDVTVLHAEAARHGIATIHAPMVCSLGRGDQHARARWIRALEHPLEPRVFENLQVVSRGSGAGPLFGGNLATLHSCAAAGRLAVPPGAVVLLEDIGERPYRVDRMITDLRRSGSLDQASGFLLGGFTQCGPGPDGISVEEVLQERLSDLGVPVLAGLPVGHDLENVPLTLGALAELDSSAATFTLRAPPEIMA